MLHVVITVSLLTLFLLLWSIYHYRLGIRRRRLNQPVHSSSRHLYKRMTRDPEEQYVAGVGYVIGDLSCSYNARSPYIRCAINPDGLCQDCRYYQKEGVKEHE